MPRILTVLAFVALMTQAVTAQTRDPRGAIRGTGVISGIVVSDDAEARPVRKARVSCGSPDYPGNTTMTDDGGRFVFAACRRDGTPSPRRRPRGWMSPTAPDGRCGQGPRFP